MIILLEDDYGLLLGKYIGGRGRGIFYGTISVLSDKNMSRTISSQSGIRNVSETSCNLNKPSFLIHLTVLSQLCTLHEMEARITVNGGLR
jgi:hypothetical protein